MNLTNTPPASISSFFIRQPILDRNQNIFGYKVVAKGGTSNLLYRIDGESSTPAPELLQYGRDGLSRLTGGQKCLIDFKRQLVIDHAYESLSPETAVLEISQQERVDDEFVEAVRLARESGYALALDDFVVDPKQQPLLDHIDLMNVEFSALDDEQHRNIIESGNRYGFMAVAEKLETQDDFALARELGYSYFQGSYFCKPKKKRAQRLLVSQLHYLRLLKAVNAEDFCFDEIDELIRQDVSLTVRLLKYLNSSAFGLRTKVSSIRQAVGLLGHRSLRQWVSLIAVEELSKEKPLELMITSLVRAKLCETIGQKVLSVEVAANGFLTGMLSLLDAILDQPMSEILSQLDLSSDIQSALLRQESPLSKLLDVSLALEEGDWRWIAALAFQMQIEEDVIQKHYEQAVLWASEITSEMA